MVYTLRFFSLQNAVCFIILTYLVPVLFTFYIQDVLKLKKNSGTKRLNALVSSKYDICHRLLHLIYRLEDKVALIVNVITFEGQLNKTTIFMFCWPCISV